MDIPRIPVHATNLNGDRRITAEYRKFVRSVPTMTTDDLRQLWGRIGGMPEAERRTFTVSEQRGLYMLIRVLRDELISRHNKGE